MRKPVVFILFCLMGLSSVLAQSDSLPAAEPELRDPQKAALMSALLPGLGQIYNHKYWKLPIVYAGLGTSIYFIRFNSSEYFSYRDAYIARMDGDSTTLDAFPFYSAGNIKSLRDYYHRNLELSYIATGVIYILNIVDATVDAHLFSFDVSDDLSLNVQPCPLSIHNQHFAGLRLTFTLN
jgi:hypothetical protein